MKLKSLAVVGLMVLAAACSSTDEEALDPTAGAGSGVGQDGLPPPGSAEYFNVVVGDRVFFDTDSSSLDAEAQATLARQAEWFNQFPGTTATVEGHADERGTREYNLALGARRAEAARSFLISQGVSSSRIRVVSFGKERPVALCSDESCWSQNRRSVSVVANAPTS